VHNSTANLADSKNLILDSSIVTQARLWYQSAYPEVSTSKSAIQAIGASHSNDWSRVLTPYWAKAQTFIQDSLLIIELPALKKGDLAFSTLQTDSDKFNFAQSPSITSLLIVINKGYIGAYAMTIMGDASYINGNYSKLKNNTYRHRDKDFTGLVFYNRMDGTFVNGWRYANGLVMNPITQNAAANPGTATQSTNKIKVDEDAPTNCYEIVTEYWEQCSYYDDDDEHPFDCFDYTVTDTYTISCGSGGGGGDGGVTPPPVVKCQPPPVSEESINGRLKINVAAPPPGGGGGTTGPGPAPSPPPTTTVSTQQNCPADITDSLKNYPCAQSIVKAIPNMTDAISNLINQTFGNNNGSLNLIFRADTDFNNAANEDGKTDPRYNNATVYTDPVTGVKSEGGNLVVTLNGAMLNSATKDYIFATLYHEAIHSYLQVMQNQLTKAQFQQQFPGVTTVTTTDANGNTATYDVLPDHTQMATTLLNGLTSAIESFDPNLPPDIATALAEGGIINDPSIIPANLAERTSSPSSKGIKCNN